MNIREYTACGMFELVTFTREGVMPRDEECGICGALGLDDGEHSLLCPFAPDVDEDATGAPMQGTVAFAGTLLDAAREA